MPTVGSLFAGIGGIDLGLEWAGWEPRWQVEWDEWCRARLADRWPELRRYGDIADVDWAGVERVDLLAGGFPCQPVSVAGRQAAQEDARWLWPEFHRAIRDLRPGLVLVENVPNLLAVGDGSAFGDVLGDLAASGYDTEWDCIPAAAVGAPHERDRVFLVAYPDVGRRRTTERDDDAGQSDPARGGAPVADAGRGGVRPHSGRGQAHGPSRAAESQEDQRQRGGDPARERGPAMADATGDRRGRRTATPGQEAGRRSHDSAARRGEPLADPDGARLEGRVFQPERGGEWFARASRVADANREPTRRAAESRRERGDWRAQPGLGRAADGLPSGLDHCWPAPPGPQYEWEPPRTVSGRIPDRTRRLKACGNAVVPQVVEVIGRRLLEVIETAA